MEKSLFIQTYLPAACAAGKTFRINPVVMLAQSAIETGWGESTLAQEHHNFFGITAYGLPSDYWQGARTDLSDDDDSPGKSSLWFRKYTSTEDSFMDFARLIRSIYPVAAALSFKPTAYAKEIAYSKYISEVNGDNHADYCRMLVSISRSIEKNPFLSTDL